MSKIVLLLALCLACVRQAPPPDPQRPAVVPANARWLGGADGGAWIALEDDGGGRFRAAIFHEDGQAWYRGSLVLTIEGNADSAAELLQAMDSWSGSEIVLRGGRKLVKPPE
ncbi:MAG: hypothetical protein U0Q16_36295 [Bryobacteraceae bacterium]